MIHCFHCFNNHNGFSQSAKGPVGKFFSKESLEEIMQKTGAKIGDSIFLACNNQKELERITSLARDKIAKELDLVEDM